MIYKIKQFFKNLVKIIVPLAIAFAIFKYVGIGETIIVIGTGILGKLVFDSHKKLHDVIMKVHKNNIDNQKALMKEIKRGQNEK